MSDKDTELLPVGKHECVTCPRCACTFAQVHPACPRCSAVRRVERELLEELLRMLDGAGMKALVRKYRATLTAALSQEGATSCRVCEGAGGLPYSGDCITCGGTGRAPS